jgi:acetylornithine/succinyldiaminopimelate/putrescine aminotransferase
VRQAVSKGVLLIRADLCSNCIRFLPPLNTPEDMLREALDVVGGAIEKANFIARQSGNEAQNDGKEVSHSGTSR